MKLHLGCGTAILNGYENLDINSPVAKQYDLENGLPDYKSNSVDGIVMSHTLCLLKNKTQLLDEIYRVLKPGAWFRLIDNSKRFYENEPPVDPTFDKGYMSRQELFDYLSKFRNVTKTELRQTFIKDKLVLMAEETSHPGFAVEMIK